MIAFQGRRVAVVQLAFLPGTRLLAAGREDGVIDFWDLDAGRPAATWRLEERWMFALFPAPDGRRLYAVPGTNEFFVYDLATGTAADVGVGRVFHAALSPDGSRLLVSHREGGATDWLRCWKLTRAGKPTPVWKGKYAAIFWGQLAFFPDGKRFVVMEEVRRPRKTLPAADVVIGDAATGKIRLRAPADELSGTSPLLVHPGGASVVGVVRTRLMVWNAATGDRVAEVPGPEGKRYFTGAVFHPSGRWLLTSSNDSTVRVWDAAAWREAKAFTWDVGKVKSVAVSPDGLLAAAGGDKGTVVVWDVDG